MKTNELKILLVDNLAEDYAPAIQASLQKHVTETVRLDITSDPSGQEVSKNSYDIVLAKLNLVDGTNFSEDLVVPLVGVMDPNDHVNGNAAKYNDFVVKQPVHPEVWTRVILNALERENLRESLQHSEHDLRKVIEQNADSIVVVDQVGTLLYINAAAKSLFGKSKLSVGDMFGFPVVAGKTTELDILGATGDRAVAEMRVVDIEWAASPACLASLRDVTQRKLTEEYLETKVKERTNELEHLNEELRRMYEVANRAAHVRALFIANFSHEVRTPLAGVVSAAELLPMADDLGEFKQLAECVANSSKHLLTLVESILDFSRLESGAVPIIKTDFSIEELIESVISSLGPAAKNNGTTVSMQVDKGIPQLVSADCVKIRQVISNLISNAIKFTVQGKVRVQAEPGTEPDGVPSVKISVSDTGIGMGSVEAESIFQPFVQGNDCIHQQFGGTGLGLAICKRLVTTMHGKIDFSTEAGKGTTFWFTFPIEKSEIDH